MKKLGAIFNVLILTLLLVACVGTIDSYTITFETNGGTPIEAIEADANFDLASLEAITTTKEGYEFDGWYTDISLDPESIVDEAITGSITLYAKWNIINYTITYHLDGGSNHLDNPSSYTILDEVVLKTPTKEGYTFNGWLIDNDSNKAITQINVGSKGNLSLHATWEATTETSYLITWKQADGTTIKTTQVLEGALPVFDGATPTKASDDAFDYAFAGWTPAVVAATKDQTYTATFTATAKGKADYNPAALNAIFGFDIYALMPGFKTNDSLLTDVSEDGYFMVYVDIFDWSVEDSDAYMLLLDEALTYDDVEQSWVIGDFFLYVFEDDETYPGEVVYGIGIYGESDGPTDPTDPVEPGTPFDATALNAIFGFDIYALIPTFTATDALLTDVSEGTLLDVYIDIFNWTEADALAYMDLLDTQLTYDDAEQSWVIGNFFLYVFEDTETYPGEVVYGIGIYGSTEDPVDPTDPTDPKDPFNPAELNTIFGFDIYALMPNFTTNDSLISNLSEGGLFEVYIDIFDWTEADANAYMDLLDAALSYDDVEQSWVIGNYYLYVFEDAETYPGEVVYGIGIYSLENGPVDPEEPVNGIYYSFNVQNTTTSLPSSYKDTIDTALLFTNSASKAIITVSHAANVATGPSGLSAGIVFAANVSGNATPTVYLEVDTLENIISNFSFQIEARDSYTNTLKGAKVQVYQSGAWVDLAGGDFYTQLSTDVVTIQIQNLNASRFRLLFTGTGATSNGGQFKISEVTLYQTASVPTYELWEDMVAVLETNLNDLDLNTYFPSFTGLSQMVLAKVSNKEYKITGVLESSDANLLSNYYQALEAAGYAIDAELSTLRGQTVYTYAVSESLAYGVYAVMDGNSVTIRVFQFDPSVEPGALETLDYQQSINAYEKQKFGISGLPSVGTFDVLVIPVEISGSPFDLGYQEKLDAVFNGTAQSTGWQSVSSYYTLSSFGRLNLSFDIAPKFVTSNNRSYYENLGQGGDQYAIVEALNGLDSQIDYSKYDSNNDGYIDSVVFIYSVDYDYDQDPWWAWVYSAKYGEADSIGQLDGKNFEYYFWASYSFLEDPIQGNSGLIYNAETYIHELGHLMGMVDFYPYEGNNDYGPMGGFDMMDYNVGDHGPFTKLVFGWLKPLLATTGAYDVTLDSYALDTDGEQSVLLIPYSGSNLEDGNAFDEYLLIMFYTPKGLYQGHLGTSTVPTLPGVVIYHVDGRTRSNATFWGDYFINDNEGSSNFINQILEADKNQSIPGSVTFRVSDMLTSGTIDLSTYQWNQGGNINVSISIQSTFDANSENVTLSVTVQ